MIGLSTPFGTRGWWDEAWKSEEPWERDEVPASQCPRISEEFLEMGATLEDLMVTIHPHPTLSEAIMEAAEVAAGAPIHIHPAKMTR